MMDEQFVNVSGKTESSKLQEIIDNQTSILDYFSDLKALAQSVAGIGTKSFSEGDYTLSAQSTSKVVKMVDPGFTLDARDIAGAFFVDSVGARSEIPLTNIDVAADTSAAGSFLVTFADLESNFSGNEDVEIITRTGDVPAYDSLNDVVKTKESDSKPQVYSTDFLSATASSATHTAYFDMEGYKSESFLLTIDTAAGTCTFTIEGTMRNDGTADVDCTDYQDVTNDCFGAISFTASNVLIDDADYLGHFKYVKIKVVCAAGGTFTVSATRKKLGT